MPRTLYAKLSLVLILLLGGLGVAYSLFTVYSSQHFLQELNQRFNRDLARQLLVQKNMTRAGSLDQGQVHELFSHYMHINPAIEIYLLDTDGNILAFEAPQMKIKRERVDPAPIRRLLSGDERYPILGDDPRSEQRQKVFSAAAVPLDGPAKQYLYVVLGGEAYDNVHSLVQESYFLQLSVLGVAVSMGIGLLAGLYLFSLMTRRLRRLTEAMERFRRSEFLDHSPYSARRHGDEADEIDALGDTFDLMASRIQEQMEKIRNQDALRRNLVANVSHDLRTPLTSLQGYLETLMLKSVELDDEKRKHYLETAYRQSERLGQLISELFELAKLDAREIPPDIEPLALPELLFDVAHKFQVRAEEKGVELQSQVEGEPPMVIADTAMINRVLENLTENALRHTPEGGRVSLSVSALIGGAEVAISNSGPGIPPEQIPHLFERFYQAPEKRSSGGAGLGLAVVKRILQLHKSEISVTSDANLTTFRFNLPQWRG